MMKTKIKWSKTFTYDFDAAGNRSLMTDPEAGRTTYSYDAAGRLEWLINQANERTTYAYDAAGRATTLTYANNAYAQSVYDDGGRITTVRNRKSDGTTISIFTYTYDDAGNRTQVVEANGDRVTWTYDDSYQLTREQRSGAAAYDVTYSYDEVGNRLTKLEAGVTVTYSYDAGDRMTVKWNPTTYVTYSYDANGNTTLQNSMGSLTTYSWDKENRLTKVELPAGGLNTMTYYGDGKRREYDDGAGARVFLWDGENISRQHDTAGNINRRYTFRPQGYGELISQDDSFHHGVYPERSRGDAMGNTDRITDANQAIVVTYSYQAFGEQTMTGSSLNRFTRSTSSGQAWGGRMGYYRQPDSEDYWLRARVYNPFNARFLNRDPFDKLRAGPALAEINAYRWPGNNPIMIADPSGLQGCPHGPGCQHHGGCVTGSMVSDGRLIRPNRPGGRGWDRRGGDGHLIRIWEGIPTPNAGTGEWPCPSLPSGPMHQPYVSMCQCRVDYKGYCGFCVLRPLATGFLGCDTVREGGVIEGFTPQGPVYKGDCRGSFVSATGVRLSVPGRIIDACPGGKPLNRCGPNVYGPLTRALQSLRSWFDAHPEKQEEVCNAISAVPGNIIEMATTSWDVPDLHDTGGWIGYYSEENCALEGMCEHTVEVGGQCFHSADLAYVAFGAMRKMCGFGLESTYDLAKLAKLLYGPMHQQQAAEWAEAGWLGWPNAGSVPDGAYKNCPHCMMYDPNRTGGVWEFTIVWRSYPVAGDA